MLSMIPQYPVSLMLDAQYIKWKGWKAGGEHCYGCESMDLILNINIVF
jgi:hypothetical protein